MANHRLHILIFDFIHVNRLPLLKSAHDIVLVPALEGRPACVELPQTQAEAVEIILKGWRRIRPIRPVPRSVWRYVIRGRRSTPVAWIFVYSHRVAEIIEAESTIGAKKKVCWFNIAVYNSFAVQFAYDSDHLVHQTLALRVFHGFWVKRSLKIHDNAIHSYHSLLIPPE